MEWPVLGGMVLTLLLLVTQVAALRVPAQWLDLNTTTLPLLGGQMSATGWAQLGTSTAVWILLPLALGLWRTARRDVS